MFAATLICIIIYEFLNNVQTTQVFRVINKSSFVFECGVLYQKFEACLTGTGSIVGSTNNNVNKSLEICVGIFLFYDLQFFSE